MRRTVAVTSSPSTAWRGTASRRPGAQDRGRSAFAAPMPATSPPWAWAIDAKVSPAWTVYVAGAEQQAAAGRRTGRARRRWPHPGPGRGQRPPPGRRRRRRRACRRSGRRTAATIGPLPSRPGRSALRAARVSTVTRSGPRRRASVSPASTVDPPAGRVRDWRPRSRPAASALTAASCAAVRWNRAARRPQGVLRRGRPVAGSTGRRPGPAGPAVSPAPARGPRRAGPRGRRGVAACRRRPP